MSVTAIGTTLSALVLVAMLAAAVVGARRGRRARADRRRLGEGLARIAARVVSVRDVEPYLRRTDRIEWVWAPNAEHDGAWTCRIVHASGDVEGRGATPLLALARVLPWLQAREEHGAPKAGAYRLASATRARLEAERAEVTVVEDDGEVA